MEEKKDILLDVRNLKKYFKSPKGTVHAVDDAYLDGVAELAWEVNHRPLCSSPDRAVRR